MLECVSCTIQHDRCSHERLSATIYADAIISLPRSFHRYLPRFHANAAPIATALPSSNPSNYLPVLYLNPPEYLNPLRRVITRNPTLGVPAFPSAMLQFRAAFGSFRQFPRFAATRRDSTRRNARSTRRGRNSLVDDVPRSRGRWLNYRAPSRLEYLVDREPRQGRTRTRTRSDGRTQLIIRPGLV